MTTLPLFPSAQPGLAWSVLKTTIDSTRALTARSGKEYRAANWSYGKYKWGLTYSVLRQNRVIQPGNVVLTELQVIMGFCRQMRGMFANFAYNDPTDNSITSQTLGTADGVQTVFPLVRAFGGWVEPVLVAHNISAVYVNGVATPTGWTATQVGQLGIDSITFTSPPVPGAVVSADFTYYWPVRFLQDEPEFENFAYQFWSLKKIEFQSVK